MVNGASGKGFEKGFSVTFCHDSFIKTNYAAAILLGANEPSKTLFKF